MVFGNTGERKSGLMLCVIPAFASEKRKEIQQISEKKVVFVLWQKQATMRVYCCNINQLVRCSLCLFGISRRLKYKSRRFGTQCRFHRPGRSGINGEDERRVIYGIGDKGASQ